MSPILGYTTHCLGVAILPPDAATTAWVNAVISNGGTVSAARQSLVNSLIVGLKADGLWTLLDRLWLHAAENTSSALTDVVNLVLATAVSSPSFTTDRGYTFNGTTNYIDTLFVPSTSGVTYTLNSALYGIYMRVGDSTAAHVPIGSRDGTGAGSNCQLFGQAGAFTYQPFINGNASTSIGNQTVVAGMVIMTRTGASACAVYSNGTSTGSGTDASSFLPATNFFVGARNNGGTADGFSTAGIAATVLGAGLNATQVSNLSSRINTYMTAIGANVY